MMRRRLEIRWDPTVISQESALCKRYTYIDTGVQECFAYAWVQVCLGLVVVMNKYRKGEEEGRKNDRTQVNDAVGDNGERRIALEWFGCCWPTTRQVFDLGDARSRLFLGESPTRIVDRSLLHVVGWY